MWNTVFFKVMHLEKERKELKESTSGIAWAFAPSSELTLASVIAFDDT